MSTGQGFAGIIMNIVRYITLFSFFSTKSEGDELRNKKFLESIIFFSFSVLVCVACTICTYVIFNNEYFKFKLRNSGEFPDNISSITTETNVGLDEKNNNEV